MKENTEQDAFDAEWEASGRAEVTPALGQTNNRFKPEVGVLYDRMAILYEPTWAVESNRGWGDSCAVNLVDLTNGERMVWWFSAQSPSGRNSIFHDRLKNMLESAFLKGHDYPIEFKFKIVENESQRTGNMYKELRPIFVASGDDIEGDLGVDPRNDPRNDASIPSKEKAKPAKAVEPSATETQWDTIKRGFGDVLGEYTAADAIKWLSGQDIDVTSEELVGSPDGKGLPRIGYGTLSVDKATEIVAALTIETTQDKE